MRRSSAGLLALLVSVGCGNKATPGGAGMSQSREAIKSAGVDLGGLKSIESLRFAAATCVGGTVEGLDTVLCEYGSPEAVKLGKKAAEGWVGQAVTASVLANGRSVLAIADRSHADPNGKAIQRVTRAFQAAR